MVILNVQPHQYIDRGDKQETKTFSNKKDAQLWSLEMELEKAWGRNIAKRSIFFTDFYRNWVYKVKKMTSTN